MLKFIRAFILSSLIVPGFVAPMNGQKQWLLYSPSEPENRHLKQWELIDPAFKNQAHKTPLHDLSRSPGGQECVDFYRNLNESYGYYLERGCYDAGPGDQNWFADVNPNELLKLRLFLSSGAGAWFGLLVAMPFHYKNFKTNPLKITLLGAVIGLSAGLLHEMTTYLKTYQKNKPYKITAGRSFLDIIKADDARACKTACEIDKRFINSKDYYSNKNALYYAAQFGSINVFNELEGLGAKPSLNDRLTLARSLRTRKIRNAIARNDIETVKQEIANNRIDVNAKIDSKGNTMLSYAIKSSNWSSSIIKLLIAHGADAHIKNNYGDSALQYCTTQYIICCNVSRNAISHDVALYEERLKAIKLLLYCNANTDELNSQNQTLKDYLLRRAIDDMGQQIPEIQRAITEIIKLIDNPQNLNHCLSLAEREEFAEILKTRSKYLGRKIQENSFDIYPASAENKKIFETAVSPLVSEYLGSIG